VTLFGRAGSFGALAHARTLPSGQLFAARAVPGWRFRPGQAAYFAAVAGDGSVLIANEPQTDNQLLPTAQDMVVSVFEPGPLRFTNLRVPTTTGRASARQPDGPAPGLVGGADVSDVQPLPGEGPGAVAFSSAAPYHGWRLSSHGQYPSFGVLTRRTGRWRLQPGGLQTAAQMAARAAPGVRSACDSRANGFREVVWDCGGFAEMALLPRSGLIVATRYFGPEPGGNGGLAVLDRSGRILASYSYAPITVRGRSLRLHPREVEADPTSPAGEERFAVILDVFDADDGEVRPFLLQELRYSARRRRIEPLSAPLVSGDQGTSGPLGFETAVYDRRGDLWAAQSRPGTLEGGDLLLYRRGAVSGCAAPCAPSARFPEAAPLGIVRSLTADPRSGAVVAVTMAGRLLELTPRAGAPRGFAARPPLDLGLDLLVDRSRRWIGPRKGALDGKRRVLWIPVQQLQSPELCPVAPCPGLALDQWLYRIELAASAG
jgi:hypothetical protein